jgi:hypothetical protein
MNIHHGSSRTNRLPEKKERIQTQPQTKAIFRGERRAPMRSRQGTSDIVQRTDDEATYLANPDEFILVSGDLSPTP